MSIREMLNRHPRIVIPVASVAAVVAIGFLLANALSGDGRPGTKQAFFTTDDGQTWFEDDLSNVPPFQHGGKEAVRAYVYQCGDGKPFVAYLERYDKATANLMRESGGTPTTKPQSGSGTIASERGLAVFTGLEYKKPGTGAWVKIIDPKAAGIRRVQCPGGDTPFPVEP